MFYIQPIVGRCKNRNGTVINLANNRSEKNYYPNSTAVYNMVRTWRFGTGILNGTHAPGLKSNYASICPHCSIVLFSSETAKFIVGTATARPGRPRVRYPIFLRECRTHRDGMGGWSDGREGRGVCVFGDQKGWMPEPA